MLLYGCCHLDVQKARINQHILPLLYQYLVPDSLAMENLTALIIYFLDKFTCKFALLPAIKRPGAPEWARKIILFQPK